MPFLFNFGALIPKTITIMKKFIIALVAVVLGLSSCSKESMILGSWKLDKIEAEGVTVNASKLGLDVTLTFKDGNKLEMAQKQDGETLTESGTYSISGDTITVEDWELTATFEVTSDTLTITATDPESELSEVKLYFKKL